MINPPRLHFAHLPTSVENLPRLAGLMGGPRLLVKRDDQTGLAMGGNKTRKLEFLLAEAQANGAQTLITAGAAQSNHCRQTAAAAAHYGLGCILVLAKQETATKLPKAGESQKPNEVEHPAEVSGNLLLDHLLGAEIVWADPGQREAVLQKTFQNAIEAGRHPYLIPYGGSNPTGASAYVFAVQEFLEQNVPVDWIVIPSSSGGTQAGMVLGARLFGFTGRVLGISVDERGDVLRSRVAELANQTATHLGEPQVFSPEDILVNDDYLGGGYGVMGEPEREAVRLFARHEGLILDPVYTGRAASGMIDLIRKGFFQKGEIVLFWHTGGTPALFAERYQDIV
jgi:D-cysteine desulfhydrase family pyridoxal phosphate-dependent enzyme